ncbi:uncharacterized protein LOC101025061 [Papio anubis]|uniref:uncharacterized protein LOC101025061 n=1 Tax=Papio anubis TaxID=9555 RepID=UPI00083F1820|nr:uncharacterized protein LOC101025061 [Papio anubis]
MGNECMGTHLSGKEGMASQPTEAHWQHRTSLQSRDSPSRKSSQALGGHGLRTRSREDTVTNPWLIWQVWAAARPVASPAPHDLCLQLSYNLGRAPMQLYGRQRCTTHIPFPGRACCPGCSECGSRWPPAISNFRELPCLRSCPFWGSSRLPEGLQKHSGHHDGQIWLMGAPLVAEALLGHIAVDFALSTFFSQELIPINIHPLPSQTVLASASGEPSLGQVSWERARLLQVACDQEDGGGRCVPMGSSLSLLVPFTLTCAS